MAFPSPWTEHSPGRGTGQRPLQEAAGSSRRSCWRPSCPRHRGTVLRTDCLSCWEACTTTSSRTRGEYFRAVRVAAVCDRLLCPGVPGRRPQLVPPLGVPGSESRPDATWRGHQGERISGTATRPLNTCVDAALGRGSLTRSPTALDCEDSRRVLSHTGLDLSRRSIVHVVAQVQMGV